jgi:PPP family 3-phenylpropionic acid transporter
LEQRSNLTDGPETPDRRGPAEASPLISDRFGVRLGFFYAALLAVTGIQMPFFPVWLEAKGLDAAEIGLVLASPMLVRVFAVPLIAREADRHGALRGTLVAGCFVAFAAMTVLGFSGGKLAILAAYVVAMVALTANGSLADAYAIKGLTMRSYGPVRLWGSAAFIAGSLGAGAVLDLISPGNLIWLLVGAVAAASGAALLLAPLPPAAVSGDRPRPSIRLLLTPAILAVVASAGLTQASHALYYGFSTIDWRAAGLGGHSIGALWAIGVFAEICLFALSARLPVWIGPFALLAIGAGGGVLRWTAMALDPPAALLPLLQCLHGLSFGATHLGSIAFLARAAPAALGATAQATFSTALGVIMAGVLAVSGALYESFGSSGYAAMALIAAAGGGFAVLAHRLGRGQL